MSLNFAFGFTLFLLFLVVLNLYFFYTLNGLNNKPVISLPLIKTDTGPIVFREIYEHLNYLPNNYKIKNSKFSYSQKQLISCFNHNNSIIRDVWEHTAKWDTDESLFPHKDGASGLLLQAIRTSSIALVDNAPKGTQLKLLLLLEGKQKLYFKPKRYNIDQVIQGSIYAGFDRHNSEVFAYYLAMVLNFTWVAPVTTRRLHVEKHIVPVATNGLKKTMLRNSSGTVCIFGKCFYCKTNETVCGDNAGLLEGAAILYLDKPFKVYKSPWRRSYNSRKMDWETDDEFCKKVTLTLSKKRLLNLVDVSIFDFLIQNGDRHRYEVYKDRIILLDNGKGLGNPYVDELDILAPLYQCCIIQASTWQQLELLSGSSLTDTIKYLSSMHNEVLATEAHYKAVERRLLKVYAAVQYCIAKHGSAKVFHHGVL